jgi:squalene-hopene/tetraprenyl-beta-curcumene cyclase
MEWTNQVRLATKPSARPVRVQPAETTSHRQHAAPRRRAILRTRQYLLGQQQDDGHWVGELEGDSILQSEYILLLAFLGREKSPEAIAAAHQLLETQRPDGGWALYPDGGVEVSASVKAYFALKITGHDPNSDDMRRARQAVLSHGGADAVNSFTRFYLALLGQISYDQCPAVPPEMTLLPKWFPLSLARISAWSRTIVVPLSIMWAHRPRRILPPEAGIRELFVKRPEDWPALRCPGQSAKPGLLSWDRFFRLTDQLLKTAERYRIRPLRARALRKAAAWIEQRTIDSDGLGAIFPPMVWHIIALRCLGHRDDSPEMIRARQQLDDLAIRERSTLRMQPCKSPVWDTANTLRALADSGLAANEPVIRSATQWLLDREVRRPGDWADKVRAEPGGWCFEYANPFYVDVDDTAMVLMALAEQADNIAPESSSDSLPPELHVVHHSTATGTKEAREQIASVDAIAGAIDRGVRWIEAMQNRDGGWGAFDKDNDHEWLCHVPFADHNAMIDPSSADLTGRVLEALGRLGRRKGDPVVDRAIGYLRSAQEADGSWVGRWGVNYIYGTWQVLVGLSQIGLSHDDPMVTAGANWLLAHQQPSGGWGESPASYEDDHLRGHGPTTASQTAWAVMGLTAAGMSRHSAVATGVRYLLSHQNDDGTWDEPEFTGTGFPRVFYLRYHMYPLYFPLMALSRWAVEIGAFLEEADQTASQLANATANTTSDA